MADEIKELKKQLDFSNEMLKPKFNVE